MLIPSKPVAAAIKEIKQGKITGRNVCQKCFGLGFRCTDKNTPSIAAEFRKCICEGGYVYTYASG
jgi:hypothetical protein